MTFLKSLWWKLFKRKTGVYLHGDGIFGVGNVESALPPIAYDPSQDPEKLLRGEVESYFE
jgi:hypothetical protein